MARVWCPWCRTDYEANVGTILQCPSCEDTFWDANVTHVTANEVETLTRDILSVPITTAASRVFTQGHNGWLADFPVVDRSKFTHGVEFSLLLCDTIFSPRVLPDDDRLNLYVKNKFIQFVPSITEYSFLSADEGTRRFLMERFGDNAVVWGERDVFGDNAHGISIALRNLACCLYSLDVRKHGEGSLKLHMQKMAGLKDDMELLMYRNVAMVALYNYYRQFIMGLRLKLTLFPSTRAERWLRDWLNKPLYTDNKIRLLKTVLDDLEVCVPSNWKADDFLDFRSSQACRRMKARFNEVLSACDDNEEQKRAVISDMRVEINRVNNVVKRVGIFNNITCSAVMSTIGALAGDVPGALIGGAGGVALAELLNAIAVKYMGRDSWPYVLQKMGR